MKFRINKTSRRKGFHKLALPKPHKPKLIKQPKLPKLPKLPKPNMGYGF